MSWSRDGSILSCLPARSRTPLYLPQGVDIELGSNTRSEASTRPSSPEDLGVFAVATPARPLLRDAYHYHTMRRVSIQIITGVQSAHVYYYGYARNITITTRTLPPNCPSHCHMRTYRMWIYLFLQYVVCILQCNGVQVSSNITIISLITKCVHYLSRLHI